MQIGELLENLRIASERLGEDEGFRREVTDDLIRLGFVVRNDNPETIRKVLTLALDIIVSAGRNVNLTDERQLEQMLVSRQNGRLNDCLRMPITQESVPRLRSPKDIADRNIIGIKKEAHISFVTKLIEQQFSIQWTTNGFGEPDGFNFYTFCDVERLGEAENGQDEQIEDKTKHLQYNPRRAHVKVQLYRFFREAQTRMEYSAEELCPPVYIRTASGWREWNPLGDTNTFTPASGFPWIRDNCVYRYIYSHAISIQENRLKQALTKHTLYWVVVQDDDFQPGNHLQLNDIGETQVYVGKASNGIKGRWLTHGGSHCKMMKRCLDNVEAMTTYDPLRLEGIQLVDARILLAKLRGERREKCALFVMKTYEGPNASVDMESDETAHINGEYPGNGNRNVDLLPEFPDWKPKKMAYGMNGRG